MSDQHPAALLPSPAADLADRLAATSTDPDLVSRASGAAATLRRRPLAAEPLARLQRVARLSPFEVDLVLLVGLPEEHAALCAAVAARHPRGRPEVTPGLAAEVLALDDDGQSSLRRSLSTGALVRTGIIEVVGEDPFPERGLRLTPGLWDLFRGIDDWPIALQRRDDRHSIPGLEGRLALAVQGPGPVVVVVRGAANRREDELVAGALAALDDAGIGSVAIDAQALGSPDAASVHAVARGMIPVLAGAPESAPLPRHPGPVIVCTHHDQPVPSDGRPMVTIEVPGRDLGENITMWTRLVPELNGGADRLAGLVRMDRLTAGRAVADARAAAAADRRPLAIDDVLAGSSRRADGGLPSSVRRVRPDAAWPDLVTTEPNERLLRSVVHRMTGQVRVLHDWGFARRRIQPGVRVLLSGPPGTGKTLATEVLAAELGLELLVVDLSSLVSKWLGETEKNIGEVFDAAERNQAVLFFDEADAIFGRRTEGGDAQSRWANLETAYLLSRVDRFDGLVALATNLRGNIDDAFVRRLDVIVEFDDPSAHDRLRLWELHLPSSAPTAPLDLAALAASYPVAGGLIRNAAASAAFVAAAADSPITQDHLLDAVEQEYQKAGRTFPGRPRIRPAVPTGGI